MTTDFCPLAHPHRRWGQGGGWRGAGRLLSFCLPFIPVERSRAQFTLHSASIRVSREFQKHSHNEATSNRSDDQVSPFLSASSYINYHICEMLRFSFSRSVLQRTFESRATINAVIYPSVFIPLSGNMSENI